MSISVQNVAVCLSRGAAVLGLIATAAIASAQTAAGDPGNAIERVDAIQTSTGVVVTIELKNAPAGIRRAFSVANQRGSRWICLRPLMALARTWWSLTKETCVRLTSCNREAVHASF